MTMFHRTNSIVFSELSIILLEGSKHQQRNIQNYMIFFEIYTVGSTFYLWVCSEGKFSSFGFLVVVLCVRKNQMC